MVDQEQKAAQPVSRRRYERERGAREAAEAMLEARSRELYDLNQSLLTETERLRAAVLEAETARQRESAALAETSALFQTLDAMVATRSDKEAFTALMTQLSKAFPSTVLLLFNLSGDSPSVVESTDSSRVGMSSPFEAAWFTKRRRSADIAKLTAKFDGPHCLDALRSFIVAPVKLQGKAQLAIAAANREPASFGSTELRLLERIAKIAAQALETMRQTRRSQSLAAAMDGAQNSASKEEDVINAPSVIDAPFEAVNRALDRLTQAQELSLDVLSNLLDAEDAEVDVAIQSALARLGPLTGCTQSTVFRVAGDDAMQISHFWHNDPSHTAALVDTTWPTDLFGTSKQLLHEGRPLLISDVENHRDHDSFCQALNMQDLTSLLLLPMHSADKLSGILAVAGQRTPFNFLPGEISVFLTIANAVDKILNEREAKEQLNRALFDLDDERTRLVATFSALPDIVLEFDNALAVVDFHPGANILSGKSIEDFKDRPLTAIFPGEPSKQIAIALEQASHQQTVSEAEFQFDLGNGQRWYQARCGQRVSSDNEVVGFVVVLRDVTLARWQGDELKRLSEIAHRTSNLVILTDADRDITWVNPAYEKRTGFKLSEVAGSALESTFRGPEISETEIAGLRDQMQAGHTIQIELSNIDRKGNEYWLDVTIQPIVSDDGRISGFMSVQSDISHLKEAEQRAISERVEAMDASRDGIALTDSNGDFLYMNKAHLQMFGFSELSEIQGMNWTKLYKPEEAQRVQRIAIPAVISAGSWSGEAIGRTKDGEIVDQEVTLTKRPDGGLLCITRDISRRRLAEAERARLKTQLEQAERREVIGQMAAGLAHDFNNLLATISGSASLADTNLPNDHPVHSHTQRILAATAKADDLVRRLLNFGTQKPELVRIDLRHPIKEAVELARNSIRGTVRLSLDLPDSECMADADATGIIQIVLNLILNARDAISLKTGEINIALSRVEALSGPFDVGIVEEAMPHWRIAVADNGPGIKPDIANEIFKAHFSTKGPKGSGLGLAIVKSICTDMGGAIKLDTAPGKGTHFDIFLPLRAPKPSVQEAIPAISGDLQGQKILVVDDDEDIVEVYRGVFESVGGLVAATTEPEDALEALTDEPEAWDLLVTDFDMPKMDGSELAKAVRSIQNDLPIMLVTALPDWQERGRDVKFSAVLGKPVSNQELVSTAISLLKPKTASET